MLTTDPTGVYTTQGAQERYRAARRSRGRHRSGITSTCWLQRLMSRCCIPSLITAWKMCGPRRYPRILLRCGPTTDRRTALARGAGLRFTGVTPGAADNSFFVPGHQLLDGEVHYTTGPLRVGLNGQNLLDKTYVSYCYGATDCNYGYQRTFNGNLTFSFSSLLHPWKED